MSLFIHNSSRILAVSLVFVTSFFVTGCSENPDRVAQKKANAAVQNAVQQYEKTGDFESARRALQGLDSAAADQEVAMLVKADLAYGSAVSAQSQLVSSYVNVDKALTSRSADVFRLDQLKLEKEHLESGVRSHDEEIKLLHNQLAGDSNGPGLKVQVEQLQSQLEKLVAQKNELTQKADQELKQANQIQAQADELLKNSQSAPAAEKAKLQQQAYDIVRGTGENKSKTAYLTAAQTFQDQAAVAASNIAMLEPKLASLKDTVAKKEQRGAELEKSEFSSLSAQKLSEMIAEINQIEERIKATDSQLAQTKEELDKKFGQVNDQLTQAGKGFKKIRNDEAIADLAKVAAADTEFRQGSAGADYGLTLRNLGARLAVMPATGSDLDAAKTTFAETCVAEGSKIVDKAIEDYNQAAAGYGKIRVRKDEFSIAALKNRILTLAQRAYLAERVENPEVKAQSLGIAKDSVEKAIQFDPAFLNSDTAKLYYKLAGVAAPKAPEPNAAAPKAKAKGGRKEKAARAPVESTEPNLAPEGVQPDTNTPSETNSVPAEPNLQG